MNTGKRAYNNWGEYLYWVYANLNMFMAAIRMGKIQYDSQCYMVRAKAFKAYKEGNWQINSLLKNNNWKVDWGKEQCWYCGQPIEQCGKLTIEHILPKVKGGDDSFDNIAYACKECNSSKGATDLIKWFININVYPPMNLICIYLKLVYKFSVEHHLMELHSEDLDTMILPFEHKSVTWLLYYISEDALEHYTEHQTDV